MPSITSFSEQTELVEIIEQLQKDIEKMDEAEMDEMFSAMADNMPPMDDDEPSTFTDCNPAPEYVYDEISVEFEITDDTATGSISIDKQSLKLFMFMFTPMMLALFAYEFNVLWKQFKLNRTQYVKLTSDSKMESGFVADKSNQRPIGLRACVFSVSFFWFVAMMVSLGTLLE
jgi:hypothetical protein